MNVHAVLDGYIGTQFWNHGKNAGNQRESASSVGLFKPKKIYKTQKFFRGFVPKNYSINALKINCIEKETIIELLFLTVS